MKKIINEIKLQSLNTHIDDFSDERVTTLNVRPSKLLPEYLDLVEYGQGVHPGAAVFDVGVDRH